MRRMKANRCRDLFGGLLVAMLAVLILSPLWGPAAYRAYDRHMAEGAQGIGRTVNDGRVCARTGPHSVG